MRCRRRPILGYEARTVEDSSLQRSKGVSVESRQPDDCKHVVTDRNVAGWLLTLL